MNPTSPNDETPKQSNARSREGAVKDIKQPIRFAGATLGARPHICAFFQSPDEEYRVLLPFIKEGFERREKAFHVVNPKLREDHVRRIESAGIDVTEAEKGGQFELCDWEAAYLPEGRFDQNRMLAEWQAVFDGAEQHGFPRTRVVAHMEWSLEEREGVSDLLEYEAKLNLVLSDRDPVICTYDLNQFSGDVIIDVMRTHPMILIGGVLQENPFYVQPDVFVRELRDREATRKAAQA